MDSSLCSGNYRVCMKVDTVGPVSGENYMLSEVCLHCLVSTSSDGLPRTLMHC